MINPLVKENNCSETKALALFRGYRVRWRPISPSFLKSEVGQSLLDTLDIPFLAKRINAFLLSEKTFLRILLPGLDVFLLSALDRKRVSLYVKSCLSKWEMAGSYKLLKLEQIFHIELGALKKVTYSPSVRVEFQSRLIPNHIIKGMEIMKSLESQMPEGVYFAKPLTLLKHPFYSDEWYQGTLLDLVMCRGLKKEFGDSKKVELVSKNECLDALYKIAASLDWLSLQGIAHRDIKLNNILMKWVDGELCPFVSDYDFVTNFGYDKISLAFYGIWDPCYQKFQIATPLTDRYAFVMLILQCLGFYLRDKKDLPKFCKEVLEGVVNGQATYLKYCPKSSKKLNVEEKKAASLLFESLFQICAAAGWMMKVFRKEPGFPLKIGKKRVMEMAESLKDGKRFSCGMNDIRAAIDALKGKNLC